MEIIKFTKINFSEVLPKVIGSFIFNPSVCHWKDNFFICIYREFVRYSGLDTEKFMKNPLTNPNHPWLGSDQAWPLYWQSMYGHDKSRVVLLSINDNLDVKLVRDYGCINGVDGRLFSINKNRFICTYNTQGKNVILKDDKDCKNRYCDLIGVRIIELKNGMCYKGKETILCPSISNEIEKNWSLWKTPSGKLKFSYGLVPRHDIYSLKINKDQVKCSGIKKISGSNDFFERLKKYYKNIAYISLSTPALLQSNGKYLAVGHLKYKYRKIEDKYTPKGSVIPVQKTSHDFNLKVKDKNSPLVLFHKRMIKENKGFHPIFVYLMFLYEFNSIYPYDITRVSPMFIPSSNYTLSFPTNLTFSPKLGSYIISYGDHDSLCNMLVMTEKEVEQSLGPLTDPKNVRFLMVN